MTVLGTLLLSFVVVALTVIWIMAIYQHVMLHIERQRRHKERAEWRRADRLL